MNKIEQLQADKEHIRKAIDLLVKSKTYTGYIISNLENIVFEIDDKIKRQEEIIQSLKD